MACIRQDTHDGSFLEVTRSSLNLPTAGLTNLSALFNRDFPVVTRAGGGGAVLYGAAGEFGGGAGVDAGFGGCEGS